MACHYFYFFDHLTCPPQGKTDSIILLIITEKSNTSAACQPTTRLRLSCCQKLRNEKPQDSHPLDAEALNIYLNNPLVTTPLKGHISCIPFPYILTSNEMTLSTTILSATEASTMEPNCASGSLSPPNHTARLT